MSKYPTGGSDRRRESLSKSRRDDHRSRRRSSSPGPSRRDRSPKPRDEKILPKTFGRREESEKEKESDDLNILQRMKSTFESSPLQMLYAYMKENQKVKIWTRNYKEVRGVMTGYITAFDKHWNLILKDVDEVYLKHKKNKTPFLREVSANENLPDIPAKVPRQKKTEEEKAAAAEAAKAAAAAAAAASESEGGVKIKKEKTKRKKKNKNTSEKRHIEQLFIRGDNVVMVTPIENEVEEESEATREEGDIEEGEHESENA